MNDHPKPTFSQYRTSATWHFDGAGGWTDRPLTEMIELRDEWSWKATIFDDRDAKTAIRQLDAIIAEKVARGDKAPTDPPPAYAVQLFDRTWELFIAQGPAILHRKTVQARADGSPAMNPVRLLAEWGYVTLGHWEWIEKGDSCFWGHHCSRVQVEAQSS